MFCISPKINGSDKISGGSQIGSDTFGNGSDIIRYPTAILSPLYIYSLTSIIQGYSPDKSNEPKVRQGRRIQVKVKRGNEINILTNLDETNTNEKHRVVNLRMVSQIRKLEARKFLKTTSKAYGTNLIQNGKWQNTEERKRKPCWIQSL